MKSQGERLKEIRNQLRLSQEELGKRIGLSRASIAAVEADKNRFSNDVLCKLLLAFDVNINYLLIGKGSIFNAPEFEDIKDEILKEVNEILVKHGIKES